MTVRAEWVLLLAGTCLLSKAGWNLVSYDAFQEHPEWFASSVAHANQTSRSAFRPAATRSILGRLEIPRLGMSVLVVEGDDDKSLSLAAGHVPGTAAFGTAGNAVIAGHRDMAFRPLRKIKAGDRIEMRAGKTYEYVVESVQIVSPDDTSVLRDGRTPTLTLITCYPFRYMGNAPRRYIVRAKLQGTGKEKGESSKLLSP